MDAPQFLDTPQGRRIAHHRTAGAGPGVVFLGGLRSDMDGTKALYLETWARNAGRAFLRLDYSGHGRSSGHFEDGAVGDWLEDARATIAARAEGPQILVGSSLGGWIALLLARQGGLPLAGLVGIAAAPDFTEDGMWAGFDTGQRAELTKAGRLAIASEYGEPMLVTRRLIEDGRAHLVLREPLSLPFPVRFLQGTADTDVGVPVALRLLDHATGPDMRLTLVDGADHRFSTPDCLDLVCTSLAEVIARAGRSA